jgi:RNA-dependent RNA polymerase
MLVEETDAIAFLGNGSKMDISYRTLSNGGLQLTTEPFFKSMMVAMYRNHIHELLSRSRILLPAEEARLMMGVMDEEGVLKPGQVGCFVNFFPLTEANSEAKQFFKIFPTVLF